MAEPFKAMQVYDVLQNIDISGRILELARACLALRLNAPARLIRKAYDGIIFAAL